MTLFLPGRIVWRDCDLIFCELLEEQYRKGYGIAKVDLWDNHAHQMVTFTFDLCSMRRWNSLTRAAQPLRRAELTNYKYHLADGTC
jgi:hypothetical protein